MQPPINSLFAIRPTKINLKLEETRTDVTLIQQKLFTPPHPSPNGNSYSQHVFYLLPKASTYPIKESSQNEFEKILSCIINSVDPKTNNQYSSPRKYKIKL